MSAALDPELEAGLRRLRLRGMRELAPELLQTAKTQRWPPHELLATLVREEIASREASNERARLKAAGFPAPKTLDGFDLKASSLPRPTFEFLASLEWLQRNDNLCLAGPAGVGKSHLAQALGRAAITAGKKVRFFAADQLIEALYRGLADNTVGKLIERLLRHDFVVIDLCRGRDYAEASGRFLWRAGVGRASGARGRRGCRHSHRASRKARTVSAGL